jgi:hypothetical protein
MSAVRIHTVWEKSNIFKEYARPDIDTLTAWLEEFDGEIREKLKK